MLGIERLVKTVSVVLSILLTVIGGAAAHHSFAIFDGARTLVFTGVVVRVNPDANHLQIFFAVMNEDRTNVIRGDDGKPKIWAVEMAGAAQSAQEGISVNSFPRGTVFSVGLHPLRSGDPAGVREASSLIKCPERTPPKPGKHCDSVDGSDFFGEGGLPDPTEDSAHAAITAN